MRTSLNESGLIGPLVTVSAGIIALIFLHIDGQSTLVVDSNAVGPKSWPRVMLLCVIVSGLLWGIVRKRQASAPSSYVGASSVNMEFAIGTTLIVLYGIAMVYIGFAFSTLLFLILWFWLFGLHAPLQIIANSTLGTIVLLYAFLKVAYLPLPRGEGFIDTLSVYLYQLLGIF